MNICLLFCDLQNILITCILTYEILLLAPLTDGKTKALRGPWLAEAQAVKLRGWARDVGLSQGTGALSGMRSE